MQPLSGPSHTSWNFFQTDSGDSQLQCHQEALCKSLTLLTAPFSVLSHFSASGFETDNITRVNGHLQMHYISHQQFILQLYLHPYVVAKSPVTPETFWVIAFGAAFPQIELVINGWLNTGTKTKNTLWIKYYFHKTTTKSTNATTFKPHSSLDIALLSISYQLLPKQILKRTRSFG